MDGQRGGVADEHDEIDVANNDWVRASLLFDYANGPSGTAWCQVRLNGSPCVTDAGVQSPLNPVTPGSWYRTLDDGATGKVGEVAVVGTGALDDLALYDAAGAFEFDTSAGTSTNGVPYAWFNDQGLAWDPAGDIDGDTYAARDEYAAGTDPWDAADFLRILATGFDDGRFVLYFNGLADVSYYSGEEVEDLAQGVWAQAQGYGPIIRANGTNVWTQATQPAGAAPQRFFRVIAAPPAE